MNNSERLGELDTTNTITGEEEKEETLPLTSLSELPEECSTQMEDLEDEELTIEDPDEG